MQVLVTGANGHIGANVVRSLLRDGHTVRAFVRKGSDLRGLEGLDIDYAYGNVMELATLEPAAEGCDAIIHLAAVYKTIAQTPEEIVEPAVAGAKNVFAAADKAGIKRIVYTSSVASIGFGTSPDDIRDGNTWNENAQNPYYIAKTQSEKEAQKLAREYGIHMVVICPTIVLGPHDYRVTPSNQLVMDWLNGKGQTYIGGMNLVDVRDVADIHVAALTRGENCQRYVAGGQNMLVKDVGQLLGSMTGIKPMHMPFPRPMMLATASIVGGMCRALGLTPPFTRDLLHEVVERYGFYTTDATSNDLGITGRPPEECLSAAMQWLKQMDKLKPAAAAKVA